MAAFAGWKFFQFWPTKGQKISWQLSCFEICKRSIFFQCSQSEKQRKVKPYTSSVKMWKILLMIAMSQKVKKNRLQAMNFTTKVSERQFFFVSDSYLFICILWCKTLDTKGPTVSRWCFYHVYIYTFGKDFLQWQQWHLCLRKYKWCKSISVEHLLLLHNL